ncbi:DUF1365 domain-containing protein [Ferrimonas marina]|uniref:DUF1365 domain-containing protein n=1 Tax=Ferrimonas marina TaxID=299255 RepID=A0A1M5VR07_9GAMM|nr:DUF1365 domain-containing protein [Ferrimonas marina]SHH77711.1 hypothetical protein SAMN02745129_2933 [Ferrimonas marina]
MNSALCVGTVAHQRWVEPAHRFEYPLHMYWLDLDEQAQWQPLWRPWCRWRREDYLGEGPLKPAVLARMSELAGTALDGQVFQLAQVRTFGLYFSPVNFYLLRQGNQFTYLLAEVSNTPWNERHTYLVPLDGPAEHDKVFHVSPFMPLAMRYRWQVRIAPDRIAIQIRCLQESRAFEANLSLTPEPLNRAALNRVTRRSPVMTFKIVWGIYWHALKLLWKRARFYPHPGRKGETP